MAKLDAVIKRLLAAPFLGAFFAQQGIKAVYQVAGLAQIQVQAEYWSSRAADSGDFLRIQGRMIGLGCVRMVHSSLSHR
jgi:hypothetical protein